VPVNYRIDKISDLWVIVCKGYTTGDEYVDCVKRAAGDPLFHWDIDLLLHLGGVTEFEIDLGHFGQIKALEEIARAQGDFSNYRVAAITRNVSDDANIKLYQAMMRQAEIEYESFDFLVDALKWLGRENAANRIVDLYNELAD
jgi:hypothetical protein